MPCALTSYIYEYWCRGFLQYHFLDDFNHGDVGWGQEKAKTYASCFLLDTYIKLTVSFTKKYEEYGLIYVQILSRSRLLKKYKKKYVLAMTNVCSDLTDSICLGHFGTILLMQLKGNKEDVKICFKYYYPECLITSLRQQTTFWRA